MITESRPSYAISAATGAGVLLLYLMTLAPTTAMWDASEYITAAYTMGIPHPPGNPLFILLGRVATLVPVSNVAVRVNALAAVCSAMTAAFWFLIAERVLHSWNAARWTRLIGAIAAAVLGATAFTVWNQSVVNEKVYTLSLAFFAVVSWLTVRWCDDPDGNSADRLLVLIAYLIGLGYCNHPAGFLVAPAVGVAVIVRRPRTFMRWRLLLAVAGALVLSLTPFAVEPIRAAWHPALNEGETTGCREQIGISCTFSKTTYTRLMAHVNRDQYGKPPLTERQAPFSAQVGMWWLYFKWQWLRDPGGNYPFAQFAIAVAFLGLGIFGGYTHWKNDRASFWFFGPLILTVTLALVYYMNFKYGASQGAPAQDVPREVRDRDYFYLWSYSAWSVWAAIGLAAVWRSLAMRLSGSESERYAMAAPVLLFALIPLVANAATASRAGETATREWAHDLLNSIEPYGVLVTLGDNDTFPLWYAQEVEGVRPDVTVAVTSLLGTDWYARGINRRPIVAYDATKGPAVYRGMNAAKPATPIFSLSSEQLDAVPEFLEAREPQIFQYRGIHAVVDPQKLDYRVLTRGDLLVLQLIKDNYGVRPVYVGRASGNYITAMGLEPYAVAQGLAYKIDTTAVQTTSDVVPVQGMGHFAYARSVELWKNFRAPAAIARRGDWVDRPSVGIPYLYLVTASVMSELADRRGDKARSEAFRDNAVDIARGARLMDLLGPDALRKTPIRGDSPASRTLTP